MDMHEHFETLCVLAVTGQIAGGELIELTDHCETCLSCRLCIADLAEVSSSLLLGRGSHGEARVARGMYERFTTRVQREGIAIRSSPRPKWSPAMFGLAVAASVCFILLPVTFLHSRSHTEDRPPWSPANERQVSQPIASRVTSAMETVGVGHSQNISKRTRGKRLHSLSMAKDQQVRSSYLNVASSTLTNRLRFYVLSAQPPGYSTFGIRQPLSFSTSRSSDLSRPSLDRVAQPVFRFDPQLVHLAYGGNPSDFAPTAPPPLRFQVPTAQ